MSVFPLTEFRNELGQPTRPASLADDYPCHGDRHGILFSHPSGMGRAATR